MNVAERPLGIITLFLLKSMKSEDDTLHPAVNAKHLIVTLPLAEQM
jgi:hypothetical protein